MRRDDVISRLKGVEQALRAEGVGALYLFGSHARDDAGVNSDIDVFIDPETDERFGFLQYMDAFETIQKAFDHKFDVGYSTRDGLSPHVRPAIEQSAIKVF